MSEMVERVAKVVVAELARQDGVEGTWLMQDGTVAYLDQGEVDMLAVARAVLEALRTPTDEMIVAGNSAAEIKIDWACAWSEESHCETAAEPFSDAENVFCAMIARALQEKEG